TSGGEQAAYTDRHAIGGHSGQGEQRETMKMNAPAIAILLLLSGCAELQQQPAETAPILRPYALPPMLRLPPQERGDIGKRLEQIQVETRGLRSKIQELHKRLNNDD